MRQNLDATIVGRIMEDPFHEECRWVLQHHSLHSEEVMGLERHPLLELFGFALLRRGFPPDLVR